MNITRRQFLYIAGTTALIPMHVRAAEEQVTILVGYPAGGAPDLVARSIGIGLRDQNITAVVENKSGAAGRLGIDNLLRAPRNGKFLLLLPSSNLTLYPHYFNDLRYDSKKDFSLLASVAEYSFALAINPKIPAKTLKEFMNWAENNKNQAQFGTPGVGSGPYFLGNYLQKLGGFHLQHIPYRGGAPALTDTIGGTIAAVFTTTPNLIKPHRSGQLRILAHSGAQRIPSIADVPTFAESGFAELSLRDRFVIVSSSKEEQSVQESRAKQLSSAAVVPAVTTLLSEAEFIPNVLGGEQLKVEINSEYKRWGNIVQAINNHS